MSQAGKSRKACPKGLVALGSNVAGPVGSRARTLAEALRRLHGESVRVVAISRFYRTPCIPEGAGPDFVNAVAAVETEVEPEALLARLHAIEASLGRVRGRRWAARVIDLDLLDLDGRILPDAQTQAAWRCLPPEAQARAAPDRLILPHPRLQDRAFVLVPLAEIAPEWHHPVLGATAEALLAARPTAERAAISPVAGPWSGISSLVKAFDTQ